MIQTKPTRTRNLTGRWSRGSRLSYPGGHIALDLDISGNLDDVFWNQLGCFKVLDICGREFGLRVFPIDCSGACGRYKRVGRCEILPLSNTSALIHSPGLKGLDSVLWLRDEFNPITTFFEDCGEHTIDIV